MKTPQTLPALAGAALLAASAAAAPAVDTTYPYEGPAVPVADWVDPSINGNGKGFPRLVEAPAVTPASANPTNNVNVISLAYVPGGINIHYQTPFGLGTAPSVQWGLSATALTKTATGSSHTYDRTPPCSMVAAVTQCSQFFHEVALTGLAADTTYYYRIPAANGTTASDVLSFTTARAAGDDAPFTVAVFNDMGYTNAQGTFEQLTTLMDTPESGGVAFTWHGGDISYADDWYSGILPCADDWPVCYNGSSSELPPGDEPASYFDTPLPAGEIANQGGPQGGDMSVLYESNWDLWQQWMHPVTARVPHMVMPGNHEAACAEFDGPGNVLTAWLDKDEANSTADAEALTYYSCPPSQRNFTAYQHRFRMPGAETGGVGNMWYSFDYGLAHFVSLDGETDYADSPEWPFIREFDGETGVPQENKTYITDSGPFGTIDNNDYKSNAAYAQYQWLVKDLAAVDRTATPWVFVMSHRPMYSTGTSSYQKHIRAAFEDVLLSAGVDAYLSGHIHWYERLWPLEAGGTIDTSAIVDNTTYYAANGRSMTHIINGMAGNIESHSTHDGSLADITAVLDQTHYGFSALEVHNASVVTWKFIRGDGAGYGDTLTLIKSPSASSMSATSSATSSSSASATGATSASSTVASAAATTTTASATSSAESYSSGYYCVAESASASDGEAYSSGYCVAVSPTASETASVTESAAESYSSGYYCVAESASASDGEAYSSGYCVAIPPSSYSEAAPVTTTEVVTSYTTYCPGPTTITQGSHTYTVSSATTLTITDCPCTLTHTLSSSAAITTEPVATASTSTTTAASTTAATPVVVATTAATAESSTSASTSPSSSVVVTSGGMTAKAPAVLAGLGAVLAVFALL